MLTLLPFPLVTLQLVGDACTASVQIESVDGMPPAFSSLDGAAPQVAVHPHPPPASSPTSTAPVLPPAGGLPPALTSSSHPPLSPQPSSHPPLPSRLSSHRRAASQETVDFGAVSLLTRETRTVRLLNTTPLPLEFEWRCHALPFPMLPLTVLKATPPYPLASAELGDVLVQVVVTLPS